MIPEGMRDVLPPEAAELRAVESALGKRFAAYGYAEVRTPWLEFAETLEQSGDDTLAGGYRLIDEQGSELMARTDMTVPIARLAATRFRDEGLPLRFWYAAKSIRPWAPRRGQDGEFLQAGAELLGLRSAAADAESVALLCDALASLGLRDARVALGNVAFYRGLVATLGLDVDDEAALLDALAERDYPLLESIAANLALPESSRRALQRTLELSGAPDGLAQARKLATDTVTEAAVEHLVDVRDLVEEAGFDEMLVFDLGLFQDLDYYTGVVFEAYAPGVGLPVASGGRYDGLVGRFDWDIPGVGFAVAVERVHAALEEAGLVPAAEPAALAFAGGLHEPGRCAELRRLGLAVAALSEDATPEPPRLRRRGGSYTLELPGAAPVEGGWRDVLRALEGL